ncbi:hypothetical protein F0U60_40465 [Archangium minus]|uniref:Uncharacterized protein n=1 Tax=Archangium minus TaxID=83450 RepID=A0ABY9X2Q3_9BACT|nr:hypothetical protein F0U60_40465 [Archangium minus]
MKEPAKERGSAAPPGPEERLEGVRSEEDRSASADAIPSSPGGKANAGPEDQIEGCAMDTIKDDEGNYLEPPD